MLCRRDLPLFSDLVGVTIETKDRGNKEITVQICGSLAAIMILDWNNFPWIMETILLWSMQSEEINVPSGISGNLDPLVKIRTVVRKSFPNEPPKSKHPPLYDAEYLI
ncbi:unnamed protein product [Cochlearia groenlandica]